jgi:uncharacterized metal-binding protein YceD (DUF177 family)
MTTLDDLKLDLKALKEGHTQLSLELEDAFFEALEETDLKKGHVHLNIDVERTGDYYELLFHTEGYVVVPCDLCLDEMRQPVVADNRLTVKLGDEYKEDDDLVVVPEEDAIFDAAWNVYEYIALSVPIRHVHAPGKCNPAMMKILEEHSAARSGEGNAEQPVDPRWAALGKLKLE